MPVPVPQIYVGLGKESTPGTPVAPTFYLPISNPAPFDNASYLEDKGLRGSMIDGPYALVPSYVHTEYAWDGAVYIDSFPSLLLSMLGQNADTGPVSGAYTHVMSLKNNAPNTGNQPPTWTVVDVNGKTALARQVKGLMFDTLQLKFGGDTLFEYASTAKGFNSSTISNPTNTPTTLLPVASWQCSASINGSPTTKVETGELTLTRQVDVINTLQNSQSPYSIFAAGFQVPGKLTFVYEDDTEIGYYLNNTQPSLVLTFTQGTASIVLQMSQCAFRVAKRNVGQNYITVDCDIQAIPNATDATAGGVSPMKATIVNSTATY